MEVLIAHTLRTEQRLRVSQEAARVVAGGDRLGADCLARLPVVSLVVRTAVGAGDFDAAFAALPAEAGCLGVLGAWVPVCLFAWVLG